MAASDVTLMSCLACHVVDLAYVGRDSSVGRTTRYELDGPGIESQWLSGLRPRSAAARLLRLRVRIPPGAWMFVLCIVQ